MKILTSGTELEVLDCFAREYANGKRELRLKIQQSAISYTDLKELLNNSGGEFVLTKDDGSTSVFSGYTFTPEIIDKTENGVEVFNVVIQCVAEAERRALEAKQQAAALEKRAADQEARITAQNAIIENLKQQILVLQLAAAELYERNLLAESTEESAEESTEETTEEEVEIEENLTDDQPETETVTEQEEQ